MKLTSSNTLIATRAINGALEMTVETTTEGVITLTLPAPAFLPALPQLLLSASALQVPPAQSQLGSLTERVTRRPKSVAFAVEPMQQHLLMAFDTGTPWELVLQLSTNQFLALARGGMKAMEAIPTEDAPPHMPN